MTEHPDRPMDAEEADWQRRDNWRRGLCDRWCDGWRYWRISRRIESHLYRIGVVSGSMHSGTRKGWRLSGIHWFGKPVYVLYVRRWWWANILGCLRRRHLPYGPVCLGVCGKCCPCPACGSPDLDCGCDYE